MTRYNTKDPDAVLDYAWDWAAPVSPDNPKGPWLRDSETISTFEVTIDPDDNTLTKNTPTKADGVITVWLTGGTVETTYDVACRITTDQGRTDERTIQLTVTNR